MPVTVNGGVATTDAPVNAEQLRRDVAAALDCARDGGVIIIPNDLGYGIAGFQPAALEKAFIAKNRPHSKPCGMFGTWRLSAEIHRLPAEKHAMIRHIVAEENLPLAVVAPIDTGHPLIRATPARSVELSSKNGTMDMVMNGGPWHEEMARQCIERGMPVYGSSANRSHTGTKYRLQDIEPEVLACAEMCFDYGTSRYATPKGLSSTVIDMTDLSVIRIGHCFDRIRAAFKARFNVELKVHEVAPQ